jgi:hypothetical protein
MSLPTTIHIDRLPNLTFDLAQLLREYQSVSHILADVTNHNNAVLVQRKFHLVQTGIETEELKKIPYTHEAIRTILNIHRFDSVTYRIVMPNTCYNWHVDKGKTCVHIPITTNIGCRFIYEHKSFLMPADGSAYVVNNGIPHSFMNAGSEPRLHLTFENLD